MSRWLKFNFALSLAQVGLLLLGLAAPPAVLADDPPAAAEELTESQREQLLEQGQRLLNEGSGHYQAGRLAEAIERLRQAELLVKRALGRDHPNTLTTINALATVYLRREDFAQATRYLEKALAITSALYGEADYRVNDARQAIRDVQVWKRISSEDRQQLAEADARRLRAEEHSQSGRFREAITIAREVLATHQRILGPEHPKSATSLHNLAALYRNLGEYDTAMPLFQQSLAIHEKVMGADHPNTANSLNSLAVLYSYQRDYDAAMPLFQRALKIREKVLGPEHPSTATCLKNLAGLYGLQGDYSQAQPLFRRTLAIHEKVLGPEHPDTVACLGNLGSLYLAQGDYDAALPLFRRTLAIHEKVLGPEHPDIVESLGNLAALYDDRGVYAKAHPLFQRAVEICEKALGLDHPDTAASLNNLAKHYRNQGDYDAALPLSTRALEIDEKALGPDHRQTAIRLDNLALLYSEQRDYDAALPLFRRTLENTEQALGAEHPDTAASLCNLGNLYLAQGDYDAALPLYQRALEIDEKALGPEHPATAISLNNLAGLYRIQGNNAKALPLSRRNLEIWEKFLGPDHPRTATSLNNLARLYDAQGDHAKALPLYERAMSLSFAHLETIASIQSQRQQLAGLDAVRHRLNTFLEFASQAQDHHVTAYQYTLSWKGSEFRRQQQMWALRDAPELAEDFFALQRVATRLATLTFKTPQPDQHETWQRQMRELTEQKEELERKLAGTSAAYRAARAEIKLEQIQAALPEGAVLVDMVEFFGRLAVFIVGREGPPVMLTIDEADEIGQLVDIWRGLPDERGRERPDFGRSPEAQQAARALRERIWQPLEPHLNGATTVLVSPDGPLCRFPLAALPGRDPQRFLLEEVAIALLPVPQALVVVDESPREAADSMLLVGDVDYSFASPTTPTPEVGPQRELIASPARRAGDENYAPLPGTRDEMEAIVRLGQTRLGAERLTTLSGPEASEAAFRKFAPRQTYLHLATHGFFASPKYRSALDRSDPQDRGPQGFNLRQAVLGYHPNLLSGLVLAAANAPGHGDDGILTAEEVQDLDLRGVRLVVLSACETGLGRTAGGEGLLGLQRAFQAAGARTVVASQWKVDDKATQALMTEFYRNLWERDLPPLDALRQAQLRMLLAYEPSTGTLRAGPEGAQRTNDQPCLPPFYWASFVLSGLGE